MPSEFSVSFPYVPVNEDPTVPLFPEPASVPVLIAETEALALSSASLPLSVSFDNKPEPLFPTLRVFPSVTSPVSSAPETSLFTPFTVIVIVAVSVDVPSDTV